MNSGKLKWPIIIEHTENIKGGFYGEQRKKKVKRWHTRASVRFDRGNRIEQNGEIFHSYDIVFTVWLYLFNRISDYDVIVFQGRKYNIVSLEPVKESKILYIKATLIQD